jgi:hypothetical protein
MSALRKLTKQWPPILAAKRKTKIGPELHKCPLCQQIIYTGKRSIEVIQVDYPEAIAGRMDVDHIKPVIAVEDSGKQKDWNKVIERMFCPEDNLQSCCWLCHAIKSAEERGERAKARKENKVERSL